MDMITLAMAKSYTDSQRIAYDENAVIAWDGNTDGLTRIDPLGFPMYRVSDKLIPPGEVQVTDTAGNQYPSIIAELIPGLVAFNEGMVISAKAGEYGEGDMVISIPESGTYFAKVDGANYLTSVSFETIVPIDQKYLPGVREINLADYGIDIATIVMSGQKISSVGDMGIWAEIDKYKEVVLVATMVETFKIAPTVYAFGRDGGAIMVGFTLVAINSSLNFMEVKIVLVKGDSTTGIFCVTTTTNLE